jgi:DNA ligase-1
MTNPSGYGFLSVGILLGEVATRKLGDQTENRENLVYEGDIDVSNWLMSEKLDGVRGYWDGRRLLSIRDRRGNLGR